MNVSKTFQRHTQRHHVHSGTLFLIALRMEQMTVVLGKLLRGGSHRDLLRRQDLDYVSKEKDNLCSEEKGHHCPVKLEDSSLALTEVRGPEKS